MKRLVGVWGVALVLVAAVAGCKGTDTPQAGGPSQPAATTPAATESTAPSPAATSAKPSPSKAPVKPLTCAQLKGAQLGSKTLHYNGYNDSIPLGDGHWAGEDGAEVDLQPQCGIGDMDGDGAADALGVVSLRTGGTGTFYTLVVWRNVGAKPVCVALYDLGDRTPVVSVTIAGKQATVVWLTRTPDAPMATVNLRRTSVYRLAGPTLVELSHTEVPYTP